MSGTDVANALHEKIAQAPYSPAAREFFEHISCAVRILRNPDACPELKKSAASMVIAAVDWTLEQ